MTDLVISDVSEALLAKLRDRAKANGRTPEEEARAALAQAVGGEARNVSELDQYLEELAAFRNSLPPWRGPASEEIIREMRDERTRHWEDLSRGRK